MTASLLLALALLQQDTVAVIPRPVVLSGSSGAFRITPETVIWTDRATAGVGLYLARVLEPALGFPLAVHVLTLGATAPPDAHRIQLEYDTSLVRRRGREAYHLSVDPTRVLIRGDSAGVFYGVQTLRQLLPVAVYREAPLQGVTWVVSAVTIDDWPRFTWRGAHLDVCRHYMPREFIKKYLDLMALHKLNTFHWHLTDDQGWRLEIKKYPRLTEVGAWRSQTLVGTMDRDSTRWVFDGQRHGGFYTQEDVQEIVAYAAERFITVVPEIEMPGHSQAAIAAYPWLGVTGDSVPVLGRWGVSSIILKPSDSTLAFYQDVLTEVLALFPGRFVHLGGDEAAKDLWRQSPWVQRRMRELRVRNEEELQGWFMKQMDRWLTDRGRRMVGWDEILDGGLAPGATVMSWRGTEGGIAAARAGHDVVMTPGRPTYFDHYQAQQRDSEPLAIGGFNPLDSVYAFEPIPQTLDSIAARHILGAQGQIWTEYIKSAKHVEYMAYPRAVALSEVLWTPVARKDYRDFLARLGVHLRRLDALDVRYRPLGQ
jgi:hexosaminidase